MNSAETAQSADKTDENLLVELSRQCVPEQAKGVVDSAFPINGLASRLYSWITTRVDTAPAPQELSDISTMRTVVEASPSDEILDELKPIEQDEGSDFQPASVPEDQLSEFSDLVNVANMPMDASPASTRQLSDEWDLIPIQPGSAELSVESALLWCLNPAIHGIRSIGVLPAPDRARRLVQMCNGDTTAAVVMAAGGEAGGAKRTRIIFEFLLRQVPFVGCPAYILTSTWIHLRAVATIAAIYGHDLDLPRTQHEILWCLLPSNPDEDAPSTGQAEIAGDSGPIAATAKAVSNVLIATAVKKSLGVSMVTDLFQLGTDLWAVGNASGVDEDGFELLSLGPSATARHYFCPQTKYNQHTFALIVLGVILPWLYRLPTILSTTILLVTAIGVASRKRILLLIPPDLVSTLSPKVIAYLVFGVHALLPVLGVSNGLTLLVQCVVPFHPVSTAERISLLVLGIMALSAGLRSAGWRPDLMGAIHVEVRKLAIFIGVFVHLLPFLDRTQAYTNRIAWLLSDTELCSTRRSLHFLSILVSASTQQMLLSQLKRRDVILHLLGAEKVFVLSLTLFFRGVSAALSNESLLPFFRQITPSPIFCCLIMVLRRYAIEAAIVLTVVPLFPTYDASPGVSMFVGLAVGAAAVVTAWTHWRNHESAYTSDMRLLFILPGIVSGKSKEVMDSMLKAGGRTAVKTVLTNLAKKLSHRIFHRKIE